MQPESQNKLFKKYPLLFRQKDLSLQETAMCWGLECPESWYYIIDNMCDVIQYYIDNNPHLNIPQVEFTQVKEKFGFGHFYYTGGDDKIHGIVQFAEYLTFSICAECGSNKNVKATKGWITYLCKDCYGK